MTQPNPPQVGDILNAAADHTPGPWTFDEICFDRRIPIRGGKTVFGRPYTVAFVNRPASAIAGQDKANARLIAAAPDLLEALQLCLEALHRTDVKAEEGAAHFAARAVLARLSRTQAPSR